MLKDFLESHHYKKSELSSNDLLPFREEYSKGFTNSNDQYYTVFFYIYADGRCNVKILPKSFLNYQRLDFFFYEKNLSYIKLLEFEEFIKFMFDAPL